MAHNVVAILEKILGRTNAGTGLRHSAGNGEDRQVRDRGDDQHSPREMDRQPDDDNTVRYLGVKVDDALTIAGAIDL